MGPVSRLEYGVAARALPGQSEAGDGYVVEDFPGGALLAVVDGLGHGAEAAAAARLACSVLGAHPKESVVSLVRRCHWILRGTRGAVMSLASIDSGQARLKWVGVGDVRGFLVRADPQAAPAYEALLARRGLVGAQLPALSAADLPLDPGDTLIFLTDGIEPGEDWGRELTSNPTPQSAAERLLARYARSTDDALVLVARYSGHPL